MSGAQGSRNRTPQWSLAGRTHRDICAALVLIISGSCSAWWRERRRASRTEPPHAPSPAPTANGGARPGRTDSSGRGTLTYGDRDEAGAPRSAVTVTFTVTGASPQAGSSVTNEAGHLPSFTYAGKARGSATSSLRSSTRPGKRWYPTKSRRRVGGAGTGAHGPASLRRRSAKRERAGRERCGVREAAFRGPLEPRRPSGESESPE